MIKHGEEKRKKKAQGSHLIVLRMSQLLYREDDFYRENLARIQNATDTEGRVVGYKVKTLVTNSILAHTWKRKQE